MFIYLIANHVTGKYYVGQHKGNNLKRYLQQKFYEADRRLGGKSYLYASMRKHGRSAFSIHALLSDVQTKIELDRCEKDFILFLKSRDHNYGYNICRGGEGRTDKGWHHKPETKEKISKSNEGKHRDRLMSPENQAKRIPAWQKSVDDRIASGAYHTPESIEAIKAARTSQDETYRVQRQKEYEAAHPERRTRAANTHRGKRHKMSEEGSVAVSEAFKRIAHKRWHVRRGLKNPACMLCA
jgi:group I intron endonuclease